MNSVPDQENFQGNSFDPIIAYGAHGAIVHYSATEETNIPLEPKGLVLMDTGGHYLEGTTDITRTVVLGPVTEKEKKYFTAVLRGHLNLAAAKFRYGCTGLNLDALARGPLWAMGEDYNHGTRPWRRLSSQCTRRTAEFSLEKPCRASGSCSGRRDDHLR